MESLTNRKKVVSDNSNPSLLINSNPTVANEVENLPILVSNRTLLPVWIACLINSSKTGPIVFSSLAKSKASLIWPVIWCSPTAWDSSPAAVENKFHITTLKNLNNRNKNID